MDYNIISGDGHIDLAWLPHDLFVSNAPEEYKSRMPMVAETEEGPRWMVEGVDVGKIPGGALASLQPPPRGKSPQIDRMYEAGFYDGRPHPATPELRLADLRMDGIDADVIYGILGMGSVMPNRESLLWVYRIYNDWLVDFCSTYPGRFVGLACIPNDSPENAAEEVRRAAAMGLKGADFGVSNLPKPIWHRDWDPLWEASAECNVPLSFHTVGLTLDGVPTDENMAKEYNLAYTATRITLFQLAGAEYLTSLIFSQVLERHPQFRFVLGECGVSWIPYVLQRADEESEDQMQAVGLDMKPSEFWHRQGFTTFQQESTAAEFVHLVGEDNVIWGSDYPHHDGVWPDSQKVIEHDLGSLEEKVRRKLTRDNTGKLYRMI
ncbi:amidohydrolase [SAR202 cluster bacterium AD-804-J14_MRT_500m]|nr:amidohydrolase [SAR202 cluster bacterium AD-804-J14_MRT_500m]